MPKKVVSNLIGSLTENFRIQKIYMGDYFLNRTKQNERYYTFILFGILGDMKQIESYTKMFSKKTK